jgi:hypothetical protein
MNKLEMFKEWYKEKFGFNPIFNHNGIEHTDTRTLYECFCSGYDAAFSDFSFNDEDDNVEDVEF